MKWLFALCFLCSPVMAGEWQISYLDDQDPVQKKVQTVDVRSGFTSQTPKFASATSRVPRVRAVFLTDEVRSSIRPNQGLRPVSLDVKGVILDQDSRSADRQKPEQSRIKHKTELTSATDRRSSKGSGVRTYPVKYETPSSVIVEGAARVEIRQPAGCTGRAMGCSGLPACGRQPAMGCAGQARWFPGRRMMQNRRARIGARRSFFGRAGC